MVEHDELKNYCRQYHWLKDGYCELLAIKQGGTYDDSEVECKEKKCPIRKLWTPN